MGEANLRAQWQVWDLIAGRLEPQLGGLGATPACTACPAVDEAHFSPARLLPDLVACRDVCLPPVALNESTRSISPTKTLGYMAADKPVVSTPVRDVQGLHGDCVCIADDAAAFVAGCEAALAETPTQQALRSSHMPTTVWRMSWDATVAAIQKLLQADAGAPVPRTLPEEQAPQSGT